MKGSLQPRQSQARFSRWSRPVADLLCQVIVQSDLADDMELAFQVIMVIFICEDLALLETLSPPGSLSSPVLSVHGDHFQRGVAFDCSSRRYTP
jgi:hypothetical protein